MSQVAYAKFNRMSVAPPATPYGSGASNGVVTGNSVGHLFDPENPGLWLLGLGALTLGLIAASTSIKVGPLRAAASV